MIIGTLTYDQDKDSYHGEITTLTFQRHVELKAVKKANKKEPDYRIVHVDGTAEFGAAWKRKSKKGQAFLSVLLDDPAMHAPMYAALFGGDQENVHSLVWKRASEEDETEAE